MVENSEDFIDSIYARKKTKVCKDENGDGSWRRQHRETLRFDLEIAMPWVASEDLLAEAQKNCSPKCDGTDSRG